mgnify:CR=1 FL=1
MSDKLYSSYRKAKKSARMGGNYLWTLTGIYRFKSLDSQLSNNRSKFPHRKWAKSSLDEVKSVMNKNPF